MDKDLEGALVFLGTLVIYILSEEFVGLFTKTLWPQLLFKIVVVGTLIIYFRQWFTFKLKFDFLAIITGIIIGVLWVLLDFLYTPFSLGPENIYATADILLKFSTGIFIAPIVEEFFTRYFLHRYVRSKDWLKQKIGVYSLVPFVVTVLFFGLSHNRWLAGIVTGILLNLLWYKQKTMNSVVLAHGIANLVLGIIVVTFGLWMFW